jgi:hypothetical protein
MPHWQRARKPAGTTGPRRPTRSPSGVIHAPDLPAGLGADPTSKAKAARATAKVTVTMDGNPAEKLPVNWPDPGDAMEPGITSITWYDVLGAVPDAETRNIMQKYDDKAALLRPELISGAPPNVLTAVTRAQHLLDTAWQVTGGHIVISSNNYRSPTRRGVGLSHRPLGKRPDSPVLRVV